jgi:aminopeptidase N
MIDMKKYLILSLTLMAGLGSVAQPQEMPSDTAWKKQYRATGERINNLQHTRLELSFSYEKSLVLGKATITLSPHFYPTDSLMLDAKGMEIQKVALMKSSGGLTPLTYTYDGMAMNIRLDKIYRKNEKYTIYIEYVSKPDEFAEKAGDKLLGAKGLYFINPKGEDKEKPIQIWTQGETESNSVWFPTIEKTNQKTTQEIYATVPAKYVSLSNGKLISQNLNGNGTRTDYWKMDQPHAPYLFFLGVGDYAVVKDQWRGKEVSYYVEKEYGPVARKIFGNTPEMMTYFSRITGVDYPWVKYAQITGRDYTAGAMENTTATIHHEGAQQDARELVDGNGWEGTIAHELFHQWFGDYVTAENWSHLTLNESFADYSQTLWEEYKYGKDAGDAENFQGMQGYLNSGSESKHLVRFYYASPDDMFDAVSYQKGGRILHMLRNYVGDSAFFKSLNHYLTTHKYKSAEAHDLRLSFEAVSGRDLNWFFNQWYFNAGHPVLDINYGYEEDKKRVRMIVKQTQQGQVFRLPVAVDIYLGAQKTRRQVWVEKALDTFYFAADRKPDLVNFDGDKILLSGKKENKNLENYLHQYKHAGKYMDRREAIDFFGRKLDDPQAVDALIRALKDPYSGLRTLALGKLDLKRENIRKSAENAILDMAKNDPNRVARGRAIGALGTYDNKAYQPIFEKALTDSSYTVAGFGLEALSRLDSVAAFNAAMKMSNAPAKGKLDQTINSVMVASGKEEVYDRMAVKYKKLGLSQDKFNMTQQMADMLGRISNQQKVREGVGLIVDFKNSIPDQYKDQLNPYLNNVILKGIADKRAAKGEKELADWIMTQAK